MMKKKLIYAAVLCASVNVNGVSALDICAVNAISFPNFDCRFTLFSSNEQAALKFAHLDAVSADGRTLFLGASEFRLATNVSIKDAAQAGCNYDNTFVSANKINQQIAFKISADNPREITELWLLNCQPDSRFFR